MLSIDTSWLLWLWIFVLSLIFDSLILGFEWWSYGSVVDPRDQSLTVMNERSLFFLVEQEWFILICFSFHYFFISVLRVFQLLRDCKFLLHLHLVLNGVL